MPVSHLATSTCRIGATSGVSSPASGWVASEDLPNNPMHSALMLVKLPAVTVEPHQAASNPS